MDGFDMESMDGMPQGESWVQALLRGARDDEMGQGFLPSAKEQDDEMGQGFLPSAKEQDDVRRAPTMEGTATDLHMLLLGFLHRGSRRMAGRCVGSHPADATTHLSDTDEASGEDRGAFAEDMLLLWHGVGARTRREMRGP